MNEKDFDQTVKELREEAHRLVQLVDDESGVGMMSWCMAVGDVVARLHALVGGGNAQ